MMSIQGLIEAIESRMLLSAAVLSDDGVLKVAGDQKAANQIDVSIVPTTVSAATEADPNATAIVNYIQIVFNGDTANAPSFPAALVKKAHIAGGNADDVINVQLKNEDGSVNIPAMIWGRNGDDTITAGDEIDWIKGGKGDDTITAGGGADRIWGEQGRNHFNLGEGSPARDWVFGDARNGKGDTWSDSDAKDQMKIKHMTKAQKASLKPANPHKPAKPAGKAAPG